MSLSFSEISEESMDDQIQRSKNYLEHLKEWLPRDTKGYEEYLKENSLSPVPPTEKHEERIRQLKKIRELIDLELEAKIYQELLAEISRKEARLPFSSPNGLRQIKDLSEAAEVLSSAKKLVVYCDMIFGDWDGCGFGYPDQKAPALTINDPEVISSIYELINSSDFKYDPEWTQRWLEGCKIGTKQHFLIEVDDVAHIYILSDMLICKMNKTYIPKKYESDENTSFTAELAKLLPIKEHLNKKTPNQKLQPTVKTPVESGNEQGTAAEL